MGTSKDKKCGSLRKWRHFLSLHNGITENVYDHRHRIKESGNRKAFRYAKETLNTFSYEPVLSDDRNSIKKGLQVMLSCNVVPKCWACDRTRCIVEILTNTVLFLQIDVNMGKCAKRTTPQINCGPSDYSFSVTGFNRLRFAIRVCLSTTANKAQRQPFTEKWRIEFRDGSVSHGHLYLALLKSSHPSNTVIISKIKDKTINNIMYPEILSINEVALRSILPMQFTWLYHEGLGTFLYYEK